MSIIDENDLVCRISRIHFAVDPQLAEVVEYHLEDKQLKIFN